MEKFFKRMNGTTKSKYYVYNKQKLFLGAYLAGFVIFTACITYALDKVYRAFCDD